MFLILQFFPETYLNIHAHLFKKVVVLSKSSRKQDIRGKASVKGVSHPSKAHDSGKAAGRQKSVKPEGHKDSMTESAGQDARRDQKQDHAKPRLNVFKVNNYVLVGIAVLAILFLSIVLFKQYGFFGKTVAATVNGESITIKDLEAEYQLYLKFVPSGYQQDFTKKMMLGYMIDESILMQNAKKAGMVVDDVELEQYIDEMIKASSIPMTKQEFIKQIESNNLSYPKVRELLYRKQFLIQKYLNLTILSKIDISESEIVQYYNQNYITSNLSIETLRPVIKQALYTKKQYDMYKELMQKLKSEAVVKNNIYADLSDLTRCMAKKGVVVYGLSDDTRMKTQKQELGDAFSYLSYIECKDPSSGLLKEECKGILTYPTWKIDGVLTVGFRSADSLSVATGCKLY